MIVDCRLFTKWNSRMITKSLSSRPPMLPFSTLRPVGVLTRATTVTLDSEYLGAGVARH